MKSINQSHRHDMMKLRLYVFITSLYFLQKINSTKNQANDIRILDIFTIGYLLTVHTPVCADHSTHTKQKERDAV